MNESPVAHSSRKRGRGLYFLGYRVSRLENFSVPCHFSNYPSEFLHSHLYGCSLKFLYKSKPKKISLAGQIGATPTLPRLQLVLRDDYRNLLHHSRFHFLMVTSSPPHLMRKDHARSSKRQPLVSFAMRSFSQSQSLQLSAGGALRRELSGKTCKTLAMLFLAPLARTGGRREVESSSHASLSSSRQYRGGGGGEKRYGYRNPCGKAFSRR